MNTLGGSTVGVDSRVARCTLLPRNWLVVAPARPPYPAQLAVCTQLYDVVQSPCTLASLTQSGRCRVRWDEVR